MQLEMVVGNIRGGGMPSLEEASACLTLGAVTKGIDLINPFWNSLGAA